MRNAVQEELGRRPAPEYSRDERDARALLASHYNLRALDLPFLRRLKKDARALLDTHNLHRETYLRLLKFHDRVAAEIDRRGRAVPDDERKARALLARYPDTTGLSTRRLRILDRKLTSLIASPLISGRTQGRLIRLREDVRAELRRRGSTRLTPVEARARRLLARADNMELLTTPMARAYWREAVDLLSLPGMRPDTRRKVARLRARLATELNARRGARTAQKILQDTRPATRLSDTQLRARLAAIRKALRIPDLPRRYLRPLRRMLARDRAELRRRVAIAENGRAEAEAALAGTDALINDHRPSRALRTPALRRRIRALRKALTLRGLSAWRRGVLARKLREDRAELRARLLRARAERRARLAHERRFQLDTGIAESPSISAAEAGRRAIERQLAAAPRQRLGRRFTLRELRARPGLRDFMPAIDLDSIHFGFNEYWVREEEIGKLERIGEAIERIIAAHSGEVFLIEGHTDAVGSADYNQRLSEKRALAVKQALTEYFNIPADNLVTIGYGERFLKIPVPDAEPENRRVSIRRITPLLER